MEKRDILNIFNNPLFTEIYLESEATTNAYERHFRSLISLVPLQPGDRVLDVGVSHGPSSLAIFEKEPMVEVVAVDPSEEVLKVCKAKFQGEELSSVLARFINNGAVLAYLGNQYQRCRQFGDRISYVQSFAEDLEGIGEFDHVVGSLSLHWMLDPYKALSAFNASLKKGGTFSTSSSAWRYKPSSSELDPTFKYSNSPFMKAFYRNLDRLLEIDTVDAEEKDEWDLTKLEELLASTEFVLSEYKEEKKPHTIGHMIMSCKAGAFYKNPARLQANSQGLIKCISESLVETFQEVDPRESVEDYYDYSPYILAKKI